MNLVQVISIPYKDEPVLLKILINVPRIYLVKNADRIRTNDNIVVQEYIDKVYYTRKTRNLQQVCSTCTGTSGGHFAKYWGRGGGGGIFNMYAFAVRFNYCNVTITLYAYILVCFLVPLAPKQRKL